LEILNCSCLHFQSRCMLLSFSIPIRTVQLGRCVVEAPVAAGRFVSARVVRLREWHASNLRESLCFSNCILRYFGACYLHGLLTGFSWLPIICKDLFINASRLDSPIFWERFYARFQEELVVLILDASRTFRKFRGCLREAWSILESVSLSWFHSVRGRGAEGLLIYSRWHRWNEHWRVVFLCELSQTRTRPRMTKFGQGQWDYYWFVGQVLDWVFIFSVQSGSGLQNPTRQIWLMQFESNVDFRILGLSNCISPNRNF